MNNYNQLKYVYSCVECNSLIEKGLIPNPNCMMCFICENEESHCFTNQKEKKIFECDCNIYCHDECMKLYMIKCDSCPYCHAKKRNETERTPLIQTERKDSSNCLSNCSSNLNQYFGLLLFINMLIDLLIAVLYLVGITIENSNIDKDVIVSVPIILLLIFDINILGSDIALLISRRSESDETENNFDVFKHSLFSSSLIYFLSYIVSILVFMQPENYSSLIVNSTYALITYQCVYIPRVFMYARN